MGSSIANSRTFPDHNQNYWQLASIQSAAQGWPGVQIGGQIALQLGVGKAITSIVIGNLLLWMMGLTIISMAAPGRYNAIENVNRYLGKTGGLFLAICLIISFVSWYILQINDSIISINSLVLLKGGTLRWGAALSMFISLISVGGIILIKRYCVVVFPLMFCFVSYLALKYVSRFHIDGLFDLSIFGIITIAAANLSGMVNLPTFFRHSRSQADSYLGLSFMILFTILFQIAMLVVSFPEENPIRAGNNAETISWISLILMMLISINLVNIYFAAAAWEMILPHRRSSKEYVVIGLIGTVAYTFLQIPTPMEFLEVMANNFIASLGIVLMMAFLVRIVVKHRPRPLEQLINLACWLLGGVIGTIAQARGLADPTQTLIVSMSVSFIAFVISIFIEETVWAMRKAV